MLQVLILQCCSSDNPALILLWLAIRCHWASPLGSWQYPMEIKQHVWQFFAKVKLCVVCYGLHEC